MILLVRIQEIGYPWAKQAVETIRVVCLALDDLVTTRHERTQAANGSAQSQGAA